MFRLTADALDSLPEVQQVPQHGGIKFDSLQIAFGSDVLILSDLATIFLIRDNVGQRSIYFAWSAGNYPDGTLGLTPYLTTQGLVRKLSMKPVVPSSTIVLSRGLAYVDLPTTEKLLWEVYHYKSAAHKRPHGWVDPPSSSILQLYAVVYGSLANTLRLSGDTAQAIRMDSVAEGVRANLAPDSR